MIRHLHQLWKWWIGQILDALPTLSTARKRAAIVAEMTDQALHLYGREVPNVDFGTLPFSGSKADRQTALAKLLAIAPYNRWVVLRLPESAGIRRQLSLPSAAEPHLASIVAHELDRVTPWRPDQAIFAAHVVSQPSRTDIIVEIAVIPRLAFARAVQCLREVDLDLIGVLLAQGDQPDAFIAIEPEMETTSRTAGYRRKIGITLAIMIILAVGVLIGHKFWVIRDLRDHMMALQQESGRVQRMLDELAALSSRTYYAVEKKRGHPIAIVTLEILSRTLPDDCWLNQISLAGDQVTLEGQASDALALLPLLTASGFFRDVHFDSKVMRDIEAGTEEFSITATVIPHAAP